MSGIDLTEGRWRWRRNLGPASPDQMNVPAEKMPKNGPFTDTLLQFQPISVEFPPDQPGSKAAPLHELLQGAWFLGSVEPDDAYTSDWDKDELLGTFWAKIYPPTRLRVYSLVLYQYKFVATNPNVETQDPPVRLFSGHLINDAPLTFFGYGMDNWHASSGYTFTLTYEPWPQPARS
jgi:hypothetical protein